jgi:hypothetical protein
MNDKQSAVRVRKLAKALNVEAKKMALEHLNIQRKQDGKTPLKRVERLWWEMYGNSFRESVRKLQSARAERKEKAQ